MMNKQYKLKVISNKKYRKKQEELGSKIIYAELQCKNLKIDSIVEIGKHRYKQWVCAALVEWLINNLNEEKNNETKRTKKAQTYAIN